MSHRLRLILMLTAALFLSGIPILHWPFSWMETFFHEISHGLIAMMTGGSIHRIVLHWDGAGWCYTRGGIRILVVLAGYAGAVGWGVVIYRSAMVGGQQTATIIGTLLLGLMGLSLLLWVRDLVSMVIMGILIILLWLLMQLRHSFWMGQLLQFVGLYVVMNAIRSPLALIDGRSQGDGTTLATLTWIPEGVWILLWVVLGLIGLRYLYNCSGTRQN